MRGRRNRLPLDFSLVLQSKKRMQVVGNVVLLIFALIFSSIFLVWTYQEEMIDSVGARMVLSYRDRFESDGNKALRQLRTGDTRSAIKMLDQKKWREIQNRDLAYPMKRRVLASLSEQLHRSKKHEELLFWSGIWRELDERDVTAMAFWYEALRQTPDRHEEGMHGLETEWRRFPSNEALARFYTSSHQGNQ